MKFHDFHDLSLGVEDLDFRVQPLPDLPGGQNRLEETADPKWSGENSLAIQLETLFNRERSDEKKELLRHVFIRTLFRRPGKRIVEVRAKNLAFSRASLSRPILKINARRKPETR